MVEEEEMPHGTRVHIIRIWSDGFMAHHGKIDSEYNNIQLFTLSVLASEDGNAKHHTMPFALGFKQKDHSTILNQLLQEIQRVGVPTERYYGQDKHPFHSVFFLQIVSNDYPERCANAVLANLDTFTHRWGYSGKYNENVTPSCQKCELGRVEHLSKGISVHGLKTAGSALNGGNPIVIPLKVVTNTSQITRSSQARKILNRPP